MLLAGNLCVSHQQGEHSAEGVLVTPQCLGHPKWYGKLHSLLACTACLATTYVSKQIASTSGYPSAAISICMPVCGKGNCAKVA